MEVEAGRVTFLAERLPKWLSERMPEILEALSSRPAPVPDRAERSDNPNKSTVAGIFDALRRPESAASAPWAPAPVKMAERLAAFERAAAEKAQSQPGAKAAAEREGNAEPRPSRGPKP